MTATTLKNIKRYTCPWSCGWYRDFTDTIEWHTSKLWHPLYGPVSERQLVELDINNHKCLHHIAAKERHVGRNTDRS